MRNLTNNLKSDPNCLQQSTCFLSQSPTVAKHYINSAIFVEMNVCNSSAFSKTNFCNPYVSTSFEYDDNPTRVMRVKTCTCDVGKDACPVHMVTDRSSGDGYFMHSANHFNQRHVNQSRNSTSSSDGSHCTVIAKKPQTIEKCSQLLEDGLKLSLTSLTSQQTEQHLCNEEAYRNWLAQKNRQKKLYEKQQIYVHELMQKEREKKLDLERKNFLFWLANKKNEERRKREEEKRLAEQEERERADKLRRQMLTEKNFQAWLKQKDEQYSLKKMIEQKRKLLKSEEKQKRLELSALAYGEWLKNSKDKPKPIPLNRGLESLRTSVSVSFINPTPWVPNIEYTKPVTK